MIATNSALSALGYPRDQSFRVWIAAIANVLASSGFSGFLRGYIVQAQATDPTQAEAGFSLFVQYAIGATSVGLTFILCVQRPRLLRRGFWLFAATLLPFASILWSQDYYGTFRHATLLSVSIFTGLATACYFSPRAIVQVTVRATIIILLSSLAIIIVLPAYGVHTTNQGAIEEFVHAGSWRGIFIHRGPFGEAMGMGLVVLIMCKQIWLPARLGLIVLTIVSLVFSTSVSSLVFAPCAVFMAAVISPRCFSGTVTAILRSVFLLSFLGICLLFLSNQNFDLLFDLLGRNSTLTGRVPTWNYVLERLDGPLFFGLGYITGYEKLIYPSVAQYISPSLYHVHNGYLDTYIGLGFVGLSLFLLVTLSALSTSVSLLRSSDVNFRELGRVAAGAICYFLLSSCTASTFFRGSNPIFCTSFLLISAVIIHRQRQNKSALSMSPRRILLLGADITV